MTPDSFDPNAIPTEREINLGNSLDEQYASEHFLGKNLREAEGLFADSFLYYEEDLMWMGPVAFRYYVRAAINYIKSDSSRGDPEVWSLDCPLAYLLEIDPDSLLPIAGLLEDACDYLLNNQSKFEVSPPGSPGNVDAADLSRMTQLRNKLAALAGNLNSPTPQDPETTDSSGLS